MDVILHRILVKCPRCWSNKSGSMSPSSSGSWSGAGGADIIDLDRYMRGNVRPSRAFSDDTKQYERLVVDAGGVSRKPCSSASGGDARLKRYSHDSGMSDGSYRQPRRAHRPHRRNTCQIGPNFRHHDPSVKTLSGRANSSSSLRAFRAVYEQALLDQQRQIARVAELCERLTERAEKTERSEKSVQNGPTGVVERNERVKVEKAPSVDTSEISSSSRSSKDQKHKDRYRTQECKTYKIIMTKLDDLNRMFLTRPPHPAHAPHPPSSTSVSVCDKLIATDPQRTVNRILSPSVQSQRRERAGSRRGASSLGSRGAGAGARTVTQAFAVDIAPRRAPRPNVLTQNVVKCDTNISDLNGCDPRCGFDLEDPVHLYCQAKKLQALAATTRRARSVEPTLVSAVSSRAPPSDHAPSDQSGRSDRSGHSDRSPSLCAVCRGYWRYLLRCLGPGPGRTVDACKCS